MKKNNKFFLAIIVLLLIIITSLFIYIKTNNTQIISNGTGINNNQVSKNSNSNNNQSGVQTSLLEDDLVGNMLKKVNLNDFSDIKFSPKKPSFRVNKDDVYNILYNFLIKKKSLSDEDISYCSRLDKNNVQEDNSSNADHCKIEFYIYKMVSTKDKNVCKIFDTKFTNSYIMDSKIKNSELCNTIYDLASKNNITDEEIKSKVKYIQGTDNLDQDTFLIFKTIANNKDFCSDVSVLGTKLECYSYLYKDTFFDKFNEIYKQITKTKYLYIF